MTNESDSDSISTTSTVLSEQKDEYPVEAILAESVTRDGKSPLYLVKWEGYPITRATWEPTTSFDDKSALLDWETKKDRQERGLEPAFDMENFRTQLKAAESAKAERRARRKTKRKRRGILTSSDEEKRGGADDDDNNDSDVGISRRDKRDDKKRRLPNQKSSEEDSGLTSDDSLMQDIRIKEFNRKHKRLRKKARIRGSRSSTEQAAPPLHQPESASRRPSTGVTAQGRQSGRRAPDVSGHQTDPVKPAAAKATARRASNTQAAKIASNVLANWDKGPPKRNVTKPDYNNSHTPTANPQLFNKLSTVRRYEKASRNERPPQEGVLQLFKPGEWNPRSFHKTQPSDSSPIQKNRDEIFVRQGQESSEGNEEQSGFDTGAPGSSQAPHTTSGQSRRSSQDTGLGRGPQVPRVTHGPSPSKPPQGTGSQPRRPSQDTSPAAPRAAIQTPSAHPQHTPDANAVQKPPARKISLTEYNKRCTAAATVDGGDKEGDDKTNVEDKMHSKDKDNRETKDGLSVKDIFHAVEAIESPAAPPEDQSNFNIEKQPVLLRGVVTSVHIGVSRVAAGRLSLTGVPPDLVQKWANLVGPELHLWLKEMVSADHFKKNWELSKANVLGEGEVQGAFESSPEDLLDLLHIYGGAGVFTNRHFTMIVYPANMESWQFMKHSSPSSVGQLRWVSFIPHEPSDDDSNLTWRSTNLNAAVKHAYKQLFKIQYAELLPPAPANLQLGKGSPQVHVFIMADTSYAWNEVLILYRILKLSGAIIFWSGQEGAWDYFSQRISYGILFIHHNFRRYGVAPTPRLVPVLAKSINIFEFGRQYHVSEPRRAVTTRGKFGIRRLFPHGGCVLLTDKMLINDPKGSYEVLRWFKKRMAESKSNTWKLMLRPGDAASWFLRAIIERADANDEDPTSVALNDTYQEISTLLHKSPGSESENPNTLSVQQIAGNDCEEINDPSLQLANMAVWADDNCATYRRFIAVCPTLIDRMECFPLVCIPSPHIYPPAMTMMMTKS
ncbi:hypothetical protein GP486_006570 [Trichoglossum hirsutum]|uniref:Chromo domain-containing protein n=1 Tax=Trichoglossum hirsutum TaxID=265104 RepID=A0A9P8L7D7_9PEZI|nr:hypothetical protein GP486_006570 [Trichoglossum hirsutum]